MRRIAKDKLLWEIKKGKRKKRIVGKAKGKEGKGPEKRRGYKMKGRNRTMEMEKNMFQIRDKKKGETLEAKGRRGEQKIHGEERTK